MNVVECSKCGKSVRVGFLIVCDLCDEGTPHDHECSHGEIQCEECYAEWLKETGQKHCLG